MPIVEGSDFAIEFPEGTDEETMMKVMGEETARRKGGQAAPAPPPQAAPAPAAQDVAAGVAPAPEPKHSKAAAFFTGLGRGASLEMVDEADAAIRAVPGWFRGEGFVDKYNKNLEQNRKEMGEIQASHPGYHLAGEIGGGVGTAVAGGAAPLIGKGILGSMSPVARTLKGIASGATTGGISGFAGGEGEESRAVGLATGTALGGALGGASEAVLGPAVQAGARALGIQPKPGMREFLNQGQPPAAGSAADAGQAIVTGVRREAEAGRQAIDAQYARAKGLLFDPAAVSTLPSRIRAAQSRDPSMVIRSPVTTPKMTQFLDLLDSEINSLPQGQGVSLERFQQIRKDINKLMSGPLDPPDRRALKIAKDEFDGLRDDMIAQGLTSGRAGAVADLQRGDAMFAEWAQQFRKDRSRKGVNDTTGAFIEKVLGKDDLTVQEAINGLTGAQGLGLQNTGAVVQRLQRILGRDSEEWQALRQGTFLKAIGREAGTAQEPMSNAALSSNLGKFIDSPLAKALYTRDELTKMTRLTKLSGKAAKGPMQDLTSSMGIAAILSTTLGVAGGPGAAAIGGGAYALADTSRRLWRASKRAAVEKAIEGTKYPLTGIGAGAGAATPAIADWMYPGELRPLPGNRQSGVSDPLRVNINRYGGQ